MQKNEGNTNNTVKRGLSTQAVVLILGVLVIACAAVVAVVLLTRQSKGSDKKIETTTAQVMTEENVASIGADLEEKVARGMFQTHMSVDWKFKDGKSAAYDAVMGNSVNNNYPFWFEVILPDTQEVVFTSGILPVGTVMDKIVLDKDLDAGEYPASIKIHMVDENGEALSGGDVGFGITITVDF